MRRSNARSLRLDPINPNPSMDSIRSFHLKQRYNSLSKTSRHSTKLNLVIMSTIAITFSILIYLLFLSFGCQNPQISRNFSIIVDGGSTGSRIHVFEFKMEGGTRKFYFGPHGLGSMRVNPGLSSYADDPKGAGRSLVELLDFGKSRVPKELWRTTEIRLMATAGLRLLDVKVQERILESCRKVLKSSGFKFRDDWASVITGSDEGLYAWVVANYALGSLGSDPQKTTGIIELGGASAQVTFASSEPVAPEFSRNLNYGNITYNLYSQSWLHFGQNVAFDSLRELLVSNGLTLATESLKELIIDPCTPKGCTHYDGLRNLSPGSSAQKYFSSFHAMGNFSECRAAALKLFRGRQDGCSYQQCALGSTFLPKLHGNFLATENFFYTSKFFGLGPTAVLSDLIVMGQQFCEEDWSNIIAKYPSHDAEDLLRYCFSAAYIVAFLHDGLGVPLDDRRIRYSNQVENIPLDWALGAFILQSTTNVAIEHPEWITTIFHGLSPGFAMLFIVSVILIFVVWYASNWRKHYWKTVFDLEKGRYLVTRISR
ncbi:hypothetical protein Nepgr_003560 [Nepenthes gracilis]|uniref:Apyrase n=1 Tax=Nepenthes gracilis TaxID=150966 RepID=A0AAD3RZQ5_NEPGR|nr:hypothetical protein Nepgr_003560 [Nepenthes gracilis]